LLHPSRAKCVDRTTVRDRRTLYVAKHDVGKIVHVDQDADGPAQAFSPAQTKVIAAAFDGLPPPRAGYASFASRKGTPLTSPMSYSALDSTGRSNRRPSSYTKTDFAA